MSELIRMSHIKKTYDGKRYILNDLEFCLNRGEVAMILGTSGCGKSTFLNIIGLLDNYSSGEYYFNDISIKKNRLNYYYIQRAMDIGFVFQSYCLIDSLSIEENILLPFLYNGYRINKSVRNDLEEIMDEFKLLDLKNKKTALLSGGEKQRVAIARAIIKKPKLIIADEPTGNLDEANAQVIINAFDKIAIQGTSVIIVTHNRQLSLGKEKVYLLEEGVLKKC